MTNKKTAKRAFLMSLVALVLCFTMLLGTTYAWFTDSVTSGNNIIKSGTLDVEMYWAKGTEAPDTATWTDASTGGIFNNDKWEPGYVEVRHIKIANKGTLALKYQLNIIANGEVSKLADVIDVYYVDPATQITDRTALTADKKLGTLTEVLANISTTASGNLPAGEDHTITLALKMQETAGNEYQNLSIGTDFSIQLFATQYTYETDSFGKDYDKDATYDGQPPVDAIEVASAEALIAAFATGGDVVITKDIALTTNIEVAADTTIWAKDGAALEFSGTFADITGEGTLTFKNVDTTTVGGAELHANGNVVFDGGTHKWSLFAIEGNANVTIKNGTFEFYAPQNSHTWTPDIILADYGTLNIEGGEITLDGHGDNSIDLGGYKKQPKNVTVNVTGGTINSGIEDLFYTESAENNKDNTHVSISGGVFNLNSGKVLTDTKTWGVPGEYANGIATITGGTFFTSYSDRVAAYLADGYELVGDVTNGYVVSAK